MVGRAGATPYGGGYLLEPAAPTRNGSHYLYAGQARRLPFMRPLQRACWRNAVTHLKQCTAEGLIAILYAKFGESFLKF